jgi:glycosyltransferase involved in cell wall biosynthesis
MFWNRPERATNDDSTVRVALVGVDTTGAAPGGMATISRTIISGFAANPMIEIKPISNFSEGSFARRSYMALKAIAQIILLRNRLDVVHIQVAAGLSIERDLALAIVARIGRLPVIAQFHGAGQIDDFNNGSPGHRLSYRWLLRICHNVALGPKACEWLRSVNTNVRACVIPNGVDVPPQVWPFPDGPPKLVFVGRLGVRKGIFDLLQALESVHRSGLRIQLDLLGDGDLDEVRLAVKSSELLRDYVSILGWRDEIAVREALRAAWALVLPSYAEGLPMAILEAMATGRAVIATRVGEIENLVVDGLSGLLIDPGDIAGLGSALRRLADDPKYTQLLGIEGYEIARGRFTNELVLMKLEELYTAVPMSLRVGAPSRTCPNGLKAADRSQ